MKIKSLQPSAFVLLICALLLAVAVVAYSGTNARLLGPPLGESIGQDVRAAIRAAVDIQAERSIYARSIEYGSVPEMRKYLAWDEGASYYVYPPLLAVVLRPFATVQEEDVIDLWVALSLVLVVASALITVYLANGSNPLKAGAWSLLAITLFLTFHPTQNVLATGNIDVLLVFLLLLTYLLYRKRMVAAGVPFAVAIAIKPQLALLSVFFLRKHEWRLVVIAGVTTLLLVIVSFSIVGWNQLSDYMVVNRLYTLGTAMRAYPLNQASFGLTLRAFSDNGYIQPLAIQPLLAQVIPAIIALAAAGAWLLATSSSDNRKDPINLLEFGVTVTTMMLILPYLGENQLLWLLLPITALLLLSIATARKGMALVFPLSALLVTLYLSHPDLHDAIWKGWEALVYENRLVDLRYLPFTGAYLYGVIALNFLAVVFLWTARNRWVTGESR